MADLTNRQLRGDQVVTVHLLGMSAHCAQLLQNIWITCPVNTVQELLRTVMSFRLVLVRGNPDGTPPTPGWTPACLSFGGWTFWSTLPSLSSVQTFDATCLGSFLIDMLKQDNKHAFFWLTQLSKVRKEGYGMLEASLAEKERLRGRLASVSPPWKAGCTGCKGRRAPRASGLNVFRGENFLKEILWGFVSVTF